MDFEVRRAIIDEGFDPDDPSVWVAMWSISSMLGEVARTQTGVGVITREGSVSALRRWTGLM
nr:hypothetical protein [Rhodococcus sp. (in: high G+C Gram-positive bacteria)]